MELDRSRIAAKIEGALVRDLEFDAASARDVAFHMTDWLRDLVDYVAFCERPEELSDDALMGLLMGFVAHVPNHMVAAHKLLMDSPVTDVFGINALDDDQWPDA